MFLRPKVPQAQNILESLMNGNGRWYSGRSKLSGIREAMRAKSLVDNQSPRAVIVACSDSRVAPEYVFDTNIGDLFVIRIAGNVITDEAIASIEYACFVLNVKVVVVLGHQNCGAVGAKLYGGGQELKSNSIRKLLGKLKLSTYSGDSYLAHVKVNVLFQKQQLLKSSLAIRRRVMDGDILLVSGIYMLDSKKVELFKNK